MRAKGNSYRQIAHALNEEGVQSPGGSTWDVSSVRTVLMNESYLGRRVWNQTRRNKRVRKGDLPPLMCPHPELGCGCGKRLGDRFRCGWFVAQ